MTCIVALNHNDVIWMGADNVLSDSSGMFSVAGSKIFQSGELIIGYAGSVRVAQILQHCLSLPGQPFNQDDMSFMVDTVTENIRQLLVSRGAVYKTNEQEFQDAYFLIGYRGVIYCVDEDWAVSTPLAPYASIGSGSQTALGTLYALMPFLDCIEPKKMLETALSAAEEHCLGVRRPFTIVQFPEPEEEEVSE